MQTRTRKPHLSAGKGRARARANTPAAGPAVRDAEGRSVALDHHAETAARETSPPREDRAG
jgi:hypothetical protein